MIGKEPIPFLVPIASIDPPQHNVDTLSAASSFVPIRRTKTRTLLFALRFWIRSVINTLPMTLVVVLMMTLYYAPARIVTPTLLDGMKELIYQNLLCLPQQIFIALTYAGCLAEIFGYEYTIRPAALVSFPVAVFNICITLFLPTSFQIRSYITLLALMIAPYMMLNLYPRPKKFATDTEAMAKDPGLLGDGTISALRKGWIGFFVVVGLFSLTIDAYLDAPLQLQFFVRTILFPFLCFLSVFYQHLFLIGLSIEHMGQRLLVSMCTGQFLQFLGRLMVSNISTGSQSKEFIALNFAMALVEFLSRISYMHRYIWYRQIKKIFHLGRQREQEQVSHSASGMEYIQNHESQSFFSRFFSVHRSVSAYAKSMRAKQVMEEVNTEIRILIIVPLLLYFLHPLYPDTEFKTIPLLGDVLYQVLAQLFFEMLGDVASVFFEAYYLQVPLEEEKQEFVDRYFAVKVYITIVCIFFVHEIILRSTLST